MIRELNIRTQQILKLVVDAYVETGQPVGSLAVSKKMGMSLSPATIRNVMAELESRGLLYAPHTSAGRMPTEAGLSVFVDGLLELDALTSEEQQKIDAHMAALRGQSKKDFCEQASGFLSGLASSAGLVFAAKNESDAIRQIEFVSLSPGQALAVLVMESGAVENRLLDIPAAVNAAALTQASNYLSHHFAGKTLAQAAADIQQAADQNRADLDTLTAKVVDSGIAALAPESSGGHLVIRGQAHLLDDVTALEDLERIRALFEELETKESMLDLLRATTSGEGVKIFIGAENELFSHSGCAMIVAPYHNTDSQMIGAVGVIGPVRLNYRRIIPVVNYTSQIISEIMN